MFYKKILKIIIHIKGNKYLQVKYIDKLNIILFLYK